MLRVSQYDDVWILDPIEWAYVRGTMILMIRLCFVVYRSGSQLMSGVEVIKKM